MATPAANIVTKASIPTKVYQLLVKTAEPFVPKKLQPLWNHPAGNYANKIRNLMLCASARVIKRAKLTDSIDMSGLHFIELIRPLSETSQFNCDFKVIFLLGDSVCAHVSVYITNGNKVEHNAKQIIEFFFFYLRFIFRWLLLLH